MTPGKITAIAIVPMSNCLKNKWISLISQHIEEHAVLRALKIGSFPYSILRGFLRQICFEEDPSLMIPDTLQLQGDIDGIIGTITTFIRKSTDSAKSKLPEIGDGWGVFPLRTSEIMPVYLCPVKTRWEINNHTKYSDPFWSGESDFAIVLMRPPLIKSEKDENEWCKRVATFIAEGTMGCAGVMMRTDFDPDKYKPLSILEMEEVLRKERSQAQKPATRKMITERAVKDYFESKDLSEVALPTNEPTSLDQQGIDLVFVNSSPQLTLTLVQVESKLHFSKLKKFSKTTEKWFDDYKKRQPSIKLCKKYYVAKDFDDEASKFAKSNDITLLSFHDIVKECREWKRALKEQGLLA